MDVKKFDLQGYLTKGVEKIVDRSVRAVISNPSQSLYMASFAKSVKKAAAYRKAQEDNGEHIPPFLICSITDTCNLNCAGCYARANHACHDVSKKPQLTAKEWDSVFSQASDMGISFILLAGGEPTVRRDVIRAAAHHRDILFPVFTNGVYLDDKYFALFEKCRNIVPIMSIEGGREATDKRRGKGMYDRLISNMKRLKAQGLIFGASVTVTSKNLDEVASERFLKTLANEGCKAVIYVEYVPVGQDDGELAFDDEIRERFEKRFNGLRERFDKMVLVAFPGDEKSSGGCIAAGRGFFHINSSGGAEPCPFSPYSDVNVIDTGLREALRSKLFTALQSGGLLMEEHRGGCVLFEKKDAVEDLIAQK